MKKILGTLWKASLPTNQRKRNSSMQTEQQTQEMETLLAQVREGWEQISALPGRMEELGNDVRDVRRAMALSRTQRVRGPASAGNVSDECAGFLGASFVAHVERSGMLEALTQSGAERDALMRAVRDTLNISSKTALSTGDVSLPATYGGEIRELI